MFEIIISDPAMERLVELRRDKGLHKRYQAVTKAVKLLAQNPRYPGLHTHEFSSFHGPNGEKVFEAYAEQSTPAAYRIFWFYGPLKNQITILAITPHP